MSKHQETEKIDFSDQMKTNCELEIHGSTQSAVVTLRHATVNNHALGRNDFSETAMKAQKFLLLPSHGLEDPLLVGGSVAVVNRNTRWLRMLRYGQTTSGIDVNHGVRPLIVVPHLTAESRTGHGPTFSVDVVQTNRFVAHQETAVSAPVTVRTVPGTDPELGVEPLHYARHQLDFTHRLRTAASLWPFQALFGPFVHHLFHKFQSQFQ